MTFGQRLNYLITKTKVTRYEINKITNIAQSTLGNYIIDKYEPSKANVMAISKYFNVEYEWLKDGIGVPPEGIVVFEKSKEKEKKRKGYDQKNELLVTEEKSDCESCRMLNNRIEFLGDLLRDRDTEIARLNQEIGRLKPNQEEPKKGKAHYG